MIRTTALGFLAGALAFPATAFAQAINVDFGTPGSTPSSAYGGAGLPGYWNTIPLTSPGQRVPLRGLDGSLNGADIRQIGATGFLEVNDPATHGDDAALIDDMVISDNDPLDACYWIDHLDAGEYVVILYGVTPGDPSLQHRVRVDDAVPGPIWIGGAWPGSHQEGVTYQSFVVEVTAGWIGFHSGVPSGVIESGLNGVQIYPADSADLDDLPVGGFVTSAFPNPATGDQRIEIVWNRPGTDVVQMPSPRLEIVDVSGRLVWSRPVIAEGNYSTILWPGLDTSGARVPASVYFARITGTEQSFRLVRSR